MRSYHVIVGLCLAIGFTNVEHRTAAGAVERLEIEERVPFARGTEFGPAGGYEKIRGQLTIAIDPANTANQAIVDLQHAPTDTDGLVRFRAPFLMLRPSDMARANGRLLYEVGNRGSVGMLAFFNEGPHTNDPSDRADAGNGFLLARGYTLLWSGWNWDVVPGRDRMQIDLPIAVDKAPDGSVVPMTGLVSAEITVNVPSQTQPVAWGNSRGYPALDTNDPDAVLTQRWSQSGSRELIPRADWRFARLTDDGPISDATHVYYPDGFKAGVLYELVYRAEEPRVVGLGLAAIRDAVAFFRFSDQDRSGRANPVAGHISHAMIFGISQSGRVINHMLWQGFHIDEAGRPVFDAALINVAGSGKGSFNHRFAQTTRHGSQHEDHQYPADFFPFTTVLQEDPITGASGDVLAVAKTRNAVPKIFYTDTSTEYWTRSASLKHTDVGGTRDAEVDERVRIYFVAGAQHGVWVFPERGINQNCANPLDHRPILRALLVRLDEWMANGVMPPPSVRPTIADGTLGSVAAWHTAFPRIPGVQLPTTNLAPPRLDMGPRWTSDGIIDNVPPAMGRAYRTLVPMPNEDGLDRGGIRLPRIAVPLGTHVGWNLRRPPYGLDGQLGRWTGSFFPFPETEDDRAAVGDSRVSIAARYASKEDYMTAVMAAADGLVTRRLLLDEDKAPLVSKASSFYDRVVDHAAADLSCTYLVP